MCLCVCRVRVACDCVSLWRCVRTLFRLAISSLSRTRIEEVFAGDMRRGESDCDDADAAAGGASGA